MDFERKIIDDLTTIYCDNVLYDFAKDFLVYYKDDIVRVKRELGIDFDVKIIFALFSNKEVFGELPYESTNFAGFYNDDGVVAYVNESGEYSKVDLFRRLMHECIHFLYENYIYGKNKERITWVDEGLAQFFSKQYSELESVDNYIKFVRDNITDLNLNKLNHEDRSFGNNNGYNLSYIAIRYLYENNSHQEFLNIIKDEEQLKNIGYNLLGKLKF